MTTYVIEVPVQGRVKVSKDGVLAFEFPRYVPIEGDDSIIWLLRKKDADAEFVVLRYR